MVTKFSQYELEQIMHERIWIGKKGFDEARFYTDKQDGIHEASEVNHDLTIKKRILEAYQRSELLKSSDIEVNVQEGHVKLKGRH